MSDLIDRQEAINALKRLWEDDLEAYGVEIPESFDAERANEAIRDLPSAGAEWIPCSERLPEKRQNVVVTVNDGYAIDTETDEWTGTGFLIYGDEVIAWMPLPKPYRIP